MAFDSQTRNALAKLTADARVLLVEEFTRQLQTIYGIQPTGQITDIESLAHLDDEQRAVAGVLRDRIRHLAAGNRQDKKAVADAVDRLIREQSFTLLNRFAALRMCEERGIVQQCVGADVRSKGFQVYLQTAGSGLGEQYDCYRTYLFCIFDEIAVDFGVLFDRYSSYGLLFPRETALFELLGILNRKELAHVWVEDEAIGWIYQYYNDPAERKKMREESAAPRNSRELAVRNQFFTPRYVVEFLTDNTLGRIWYEMVKGRTRLKEQCRYLVRRPTEIFLTEGEAPPNQESITNNQELSQSELLRAPVHIPHRPLKDPREIRMLDPACGSMHFGLYAFDLYEHIYEEAWTNPNLGPDLWRLCGWEPRLVRDMPVRIADPASVRLRPNSTVKCFNSGKECRIEEAIVVLADLYDTSWTAGRPMIYHPDMVEEKHGMLALTIPLRDFDFTQAIAQGWFAAETGLVFLEMADCFDYRTLETEANGMFQFLTEAAGAKSLAVIRRHAPRLIIEHNLHGIDIDPRCTQIAGLSLWLRAQKAWQQLRIKPADRPTIKRSNIVCAEPMPGKKELLREFVEREFPATERAVCLRLLETIFDKMQLAGEAGSLLKIEEDIRSAIEAAREAWQKLATRPRELFSATELNQISTAPELTGLEEAAASPITDHRLLTTDFWERIEERLYAALRDYAEQVDHGGDFQRRLFAEDAARGFAFIDVCRKHYDVALMNPPFGDPSKLSRKTLEETYEHLSNDMSVCFVQRMAELLSSSGRLGILSPRNPLFLESFVDYRRHFLLDVLNVLFLADLGFGVLDNAMIEVTAAVLQKPEAGRRTPQMTMFRLLNTIQRDVELHRGAKSLCGESVYHVEEVALRRIESSPFCYWLTPNLLTKLAKMRLLKDVADAKWGLFTADDPRFLRAWWEVIATENWPAYFKGGIFSRFIYVPDLVLDWRSDGKAIKENRDKLGRSRSRLPNPEFYFRKGLSFPNVTFKGLAIRALPEASIFSLKGPGIFPHDVRLTGSLLALLNSKVAELFVSAQSPTRRWDLAQISRIPIPPISKSAALKLESCALECRQAELPFWCASESSRYFRPAGWATTRPVSLRTGFEKFAAQMEDAREKSENSLWEVDTIAQEIYELDERDRACVAKFTGDVRQQNDKDAETEESDGEDASESASLTEFCKAKVSFSFGCAFGRWDIRYATGDRLTPELPDPFAPLPVCPPGQLQNAQGLPARPEDVPAAYPVRIPWDGILVDDPNHPLDLERRVREIIEIIWKDRADAIEAEACEILGVKSLRDYFRKPAGFFTDHLKRYSKSRRQAPIYWPFSTASGNYTLWIYYHRLDDQTLFQCVTDFLEPKVRDVSRDIERLQKDLVDGGTAGQRDDLDAMMDFRLELEGMKTEILRVAHLPYKPDLNDGVIINAAPLWKLFRLNKWQKDCRECWGKLETGDCDWAHMAFHMWPDRVREKCRTDKSLAIAHDLEELYEEPPAKSNKRAVKRRAAKKQPEEELDI